MGANPEYAAGEVIANKYVVEGLAGESPAARSYLANQNFGSQKLCIKVYRKEVSERLMSATDFFLKAGVMTEVEHDNLCSTLDVQEEMGQVFVARAFAEGESWEDWLRRKRADGNYFSRGLELLWQTCQGLTALHERTRHLSIHPGNVLVGPLAAKLCDWDPRALGLSELAPDALPIRPEYVGYRAPETLGRGAFMCYPSSDLFSVGGLFYRLVKGDHPTQSSTANLQEIKSFDRDISNFLLKAMHPRPEERFQETSAFSDALWDLQSAMQRLQERNARSGATSPPPAPKPVVPPIQPKLVVTAPDPFFQESPAPVSGGFAEAFPGKEPTFMGTAAPASGSETFFNFFPAAETPAKPANHTVEPNFTDPPANATERKSSGDTLFGVPSFQSTPNNNPPTPDFGSFASNPPNFQAQRPAAPPSFSPASFPKSGLESLEAPGTLFGSAPPLFSTPAKPEPRFEATRPAAPKPMAVSLSSLEKDPLEASNDGSATGFTQFGFKGAGENRTGIFSPEKKAAATKAKLMMALIIVGIVAVLLGLGGLFLYLRNSTAGKVAESSLPPTETQPVPNPTPTAVRSDPNGLRSDPNANRSAPTAVRSESAAEREVNTTSAPATVTPDPRPSPSKPPKVAVNEPSPPSNSKVSPERQADLMAMITAQTWPASAAERLRAGDDFNDLGKTAEANMAYAKAMAAANLTEKQKISALGGLAVTFQAMGMLDQARDAVQQILTINPKNAFALKLRGRLK